MEARGQLLQPLQGEVLEIGFGTGLNLPFYQGVDLLYALEPSTEVWQLAQERVRQTPFEVRHIQARAEKLPFADQSLDHIVSTWTLCSVQNLEQSLAELDRVLKPTGRLHLVEHVQWDNHQYLKRMQDMLTPVQKILAEGCHLNRNIELALLKQGFHIAEKHYFEAEGLPKVARRMLLARADKRA